MTTVCSDRRAWWARNIITRQTNPPTPSAKKPEREASHCRGAAWRGGFFARGYADATYPRLKVWTRRSKVWVTLRPKHNEPMGQKNGIWTLAQPFFLPPPDESGTRPRPKSPNLTRPLASFPPLEGGGAQRRKERENPQGDAEQ